MVKKVDKNNYKGWLNSDKFLKRAFAILGYSTVANLIIYGIIIIIALLIMLIAIVLGLLF